VLCDAFAGVGPLAIRAAKKGCRVLANDLNPASFRFLTENATKNKVSARLSAFNLDARDFLLQVTRAEGQFAAVPCFTHLYMNLPKDALEFLDVLKGGFPRARWPVLPTVHVYGFAKQKNSEQELVQRVLDVWGDFDTSGLKVIQVRDVSAKKIMYCLEFQVPEVVGFYAPDEPRKKQKVEEE
jgi:tRNA (guanine37-N1)-methyltransferase